ncbi:MAG: EAL domain-containing protein [Lachnospiraceae bacterium]
MITYNYDFDIAAIIIYIVVFLIYFKKRHIKNSQYYSFSILIFTALFMAIWDIASGVMIECQIYNTGLFIITTLYYLSLQAAIFAFVLYLVDCLVMQEMYTRKLKIHLFFPVFIMAILILTNYFTGFVFRIDENGYTTGPLLFLSYVVAFIYVVGGAVYVIIHRKEYNPVLRFTILGIIVMNLVPVLFQAVFKEYLLLSFGFAVSIMLLLISGQDQEAVLDPETGMANKSYLSHVVSKMIFNKYEFSAILIRIADFDLITTTYGVNNSEEMIKEMALYLQNFAPLGKTFQVSDRSFVLIPKSNNDIEPMEDEIYEGLSKSWKINGAQIVCSVFVTRVDYPQRVHTLDEFNAHLTYFQKMHRMRFGVVAPEELVVKDKIRQQQVERAIQLGLENHSFDVYYQPICTTRDQRFVSAEALIRLTDPELGPISPAEFIPISEKNGTIIQIGYFVLEEVCKFIAEHDMEALGIEYIELNLSAIQCLQRDFMEHVDEILQRHHIESRYICFEITETASNCAPAIFTENLDALTKRGHVLALDDFGTGYGNLQRLVTSSFGIIKFDKDMIQQTCAEERLRIPFTKMQSMIHSMDAKVVAEGVETEEQYELLKAAGCDYIQGYYFSKPVPKLEYIEFLKEHMK